MSTQPLVQIGGPDIEQAIQQRLAEERARLEHEGGTGRDEWEDETCLEHGAAD